MIEHRWFSTEAKPDWADRLIAVFDTAIRDNQAQPRKLASDHVLRLLEPQLKELGYLVESGKSRSKLVLLPVKDAKTEDPIGEPIQVDAYHPLNCVVLEVEGAAAWINYHYARDLLNASIIADVRNLAIAVPISIDDNRPFNSISGFLDRLHRCGRLVLPLQGILLIGY